MHPTCRKNYRWLIREKTRGSKGNRPKAVRLIRSDSVAAAPYGRHGKAIYQGPTVLSPNAPGSPSKGCQRYAPELDDSGPDPGQAIERCWRDLKQHYLTDRTCAAANAFERTIPDAVARLNLTACLSELARLFLPIPMLWFHAGSGVHAHHL